MKKIKSAQLNLLRCCLLTIALQPCCFLNLQAKEETSLPTPPSRDELLLAKIDSANVPRENRTKRNPFGIGSDSDSKECSRAPVKPIRRPNYSQIEQPPQDPGYTISVENHSPVSESETIPSVSPTQTEDVTNVDEPQPHSISSEPAEFHFSNDQPVEMISQWKKGYIEHDELPTESVVEPNPYSISSEPLEYDFSPKNQTVETFSEWDGYSPEALQNPSDDIENSAIPSDESQKYHVITPNSEYTETLAEDPDSIRVELEQIPSDQNQIEFDNSSYDQIETVDQPDCEPDFSPDSSDTITQWDESSPNSVDTHSSFTPFTPPEAATTIPATIPATIQPPTEDQNKANVPSTTVEPLIKTTDSAPASTKSVVPAQPKPATDNSIRSFNKQIEAPYQAVRESNQAILQKPPAEAFVRTPNQNNLNNGSSQLPATPVLRSPLAEPVSNPVLPPKADLIQTPQVNETSQSTVRPGEPARPVTTPPQNASAPAEQTGLQEVSINFNNVSMIEYIRFISKVSNKNFIFDDADLQFNVTIISEQPTSVDNLMAALLQALKIRNLSLMLEGNNIIIHRNPNVRSPAPLMAEGIPTPINADLMTRVFRLNTLDPSRAAEIIKPLISDDALIQILGNSNTIIITDITSNVTKIAQLITSLDAPNSGVTIGQYVVRNAFVDSLTVLAERILTPIAQGNPFVLVPQPATNSIFIVSNPFIVERALAIMENLDINEGRTRIFNLENLKLNEERQREEALRVARERSAGRGPGGTGGPGGTDISPEEQALLNALNAELTSGPRIPQELPSGHIERTVFFIHKLKYRLGDQIEVALRKIADSLLIAGTANGDLVSAINSIQWIESSNSLILTGTPSALDRVRGLIEEIDTPLRQVFIEMLIMNTTISDSLQYGVDWGTRFGGGGTAGAQAFVDSIASPLTTGLDTVFSNATTTPLANSISIPNAAQLARTQGYHGGIIGRHLTHCGTQFSTIGALVNALHTDSKTNILLNPKIITEDNHTAQVFVGQTVRYKTQSIANDFGTILTNNFQFLDVGTTLNVTPLIGNDNVITIDLIQEITTPIPTANIVTNAQADSVNLIPVLAKTRTATKVHVPDGFFVIISGLIQDINTRATDRVPCLGGIPIIGGLNKHITNQDDKNNLMIFMRPLIVDSEVELQEITKRNQDIFREKNKYRRRWNYEIDEALDFLNIQPSDPDEIGCTTK